MKAALLAGLEEAIDKWMDAHCEDDDWPQAYVYQGEAADMAQAAALVFDASAKGQEFAENA